jgi:hypothetical protein
MQKRFSQTRLSRRQLAVLSVVMCVELPPRTIDILRVLHGPDFGCRQDTYLACFTSMTRTLRRLARRGLVTRTDDRRWRLTTWGHVPLVDKGLLRAVPW